jgi:hypothetical protein
MTQEKLNISIRDDAIYQWAEDVIACHTHRYTFGYGKSFYTAIFTAPKIFRYDIICSIIDMTDNIDDDDCELKDARRTALQFADEKGWNIPQ